MLQRTAATIVDAMRGLADLDDAALEIAKSQLPVSSLDSISTEAGRLLLEAGAVSTLDEGIVVFHQRLARKRPALGRILRRADVREGRIRRRRRSPRQRAYSGIVRAGLVTRESKTGRIKGVGVRGRKILKKARIKAEKASKAKILKKQRTALKKLKGIGG